jgi:hypothetical protein
MTEQELVIMFTGMALAGALPQLDRKDIPTLAKQAVQLATAAVGELQNQGFNWPEPITTSKESKEDPQMSLSTQ